jgi:hypothetical protein
MTVDVVARWFGWPTTQFGTSERISDLSGRKFPLQGRTVEMRSEPRERLRSHIDEHGDVGASQQV